LLGIGLIPSEPDFYNTRRAFLRLNRKSDRGTSTKIAGHVKGGWNLGSQSNETIASDSTDPLSQILGDMPGVAMYGGLAPALAEEPQ
jgi:hypothetical protein